MRVLVTGAAGFAGRHLVAHLQHAGDDVSICQAEITDVTAVAASFARCRPETVYHLAAQAHVGVSFQDPCATLRVNVEGTFNVLDAAAHTGVARVVVISSADVYGKVSPNCLPVDESTPMRPITPYGASKAAAEMMCVQAGLGRGLAVIRARAFNHIGPGQSERYVAAALAARVVASERSGKNAVRVGNLTALRDFTDVRDVVRAYRLLATSGEPGEVYNVCSGTARRIEELAEHLVACASHPMRLEPDPTLLRPVEVPEMRGDPTKLQEATGWQPELPLEQTLDDLLNYWRSQPEVPTAATGTTQDPKGLPSQPPTDLAVDITATPRDMTSLPSQAHTDLPDAVTATTDDSSERGVGTAAARR